MTAAERAKAQDVVIAEMQATILVMGKELVAQAAYTQEIVSWAQAQFELVAAKPTAAKPTSVKAARREAWCAAVRRLQGAQAPKKYFTEEEVEAEMAAS